MTIAKEIQNLLAAGSLTFRQLHDKIGGDDAKLRRSIGNLKYNGKIKVAGDEAMTVTLLAGGAPPPGP